MYRRVLCGPNCGLATTLIAHGARPAETLVSRVATSPASEFDDGNMCTLVLTQRSVWIFVVLATGASVKTSRVDFDTKQPSKIINTDNPEQNRNHFNKRPNTSQALGQTDRVPAVARVPFFPGREYRTVPAGVCELGSHLMSFAFIYCSIYYGNLQ